VLVSRALDARGRGRYGAEAAFWSRAADLTPDLVLAAERILAAASARFVGGSTNLSRELLERARPHLATPMVRAQAYRLEAALNSFTVPSEIPCVLLEAAKEIEALDPRLARDTYADALAACTVSAQLTNGTTPSEVALVALRAPASPDAQPTVADVLLEAFGTRYAIGYADAVPIYRQGVAMLCASSAEPGISRWSVLGSKAAEELWDVNGYVTMLRAMERTERERGAIDSLRVTLNRLADYEMWTGRFARADEYHSEAAEIGGALGENPATWYMVKAELFAWQGRESDARAAAAGLMADLDGETPAGVALNSAHLALAVLDVANCRYEDALMNANRSSMSTRSLMATIVFGRSSKPAPGPATSISPRVPSHDSVNAFRRAERHGHSASLLARRQCWPTGTRPSSCTGMRYSTSEPPRCKRTSPRAHLLYGEWLRRSGRRADARSELRRAHEMFAAMGAEPSPNVPPASWARPVNGPAAARSRRRPS
jgi:hypothetical protein